MRNNFDRQKWILELGVALSMGKSRWKTGEVTEVATHRSQPWLGPATVINAVSDVLIYLAFLFRAIENDKVTDQKVATPSELPLTPKLRPIQFRLSMYIYENVSRIADAHETGADFASFYIFALKSCCRVCCFLEIGSYLTLFPQSYFDYPSSRITGMYPPYHNSHNWRILNVFNVDE